MKVKGFGLLLSLLVGGLVITGSIFPALPACAETEADRPLVRGISIAMDYTGVVVPAGDDVSLDLNVRNSGPEPENIDLTMPLVPKGWKARFKTYNFEVTGINVDSDSSRTVTFAAEPDDTVVPGEYTFEVLGKTQDGAFTSEGRFKVTVTKKEKEKKAKGVNLQTSYPVLQGPTDASFEFSLEVESKIDKDTIFNLSAVGPENWDINFKPAYEEKFISSLRIKANQSTTMAVEVKPYALAEPGQYPVKVKVSSENAQAEAEMTVVLTGTHAIDVMTADGLLSLDSYQGEESNLSFYVKNSGSAPQNNVSLLSIKPENWKVSFTPEKIDTLAPGDLKQVEVAITPSEQALVGDYSVNLAVNGEKNSKNLELRVTVKASSAWGWVGIGIIVLVILGLVLLFVRMGRR